MSEILKIVIKREKFPLKSPGRNKRLWFIEINADISRHFFVKIIALDGYSLRSSHLWRESHQENFIKEAIYQR
jgi:hypothetical protein